jgi:ribosomal protein S18
LNCLNFVKNLSIMNHSTLELYLYMGNSEPIIEWLKSEGVVTKEQARQRLVGAVKSNIYSVIGHSSGSLAGTSLASTKILDAFPDEAPKEKGIEEVDFKDIKIIVSDFLKETEEISGSSETINREQRIRKMALFINEAFKQEGIVEA